MKKVLYIVDTFSLLFQVYHAIAEMTGPKGQPTNAVFGFTRDLIHLRQDKKPTHLICALDSREPGVRGDIYPEYKENRAEVPVDLAPQIPLVMDVIEGFRIPAVECPGWEADDVMATLARQAAEQGFEVCLVTNDKDARQLIGPHVRLYNVRKDSFLDEAALKKEWGIRPDQVVDFQALVGDPTDNVPGVPLVGPKKGKALLERFQTLDDVLAHADEAPGKKLRENLKEFAEQALLSRKLVTLNCQLPVQFDPEQARLHEPRRDRLLALFRELGFRRFADEIGGATRQESLFKHEHNWQLVDSQSSFERFLGELKRQKQVCLDLETTSLDAVRADIVGWAFCWPGSPGYYVPVQGPPGTAVLDERMVLEAVRPVLEDPGVRIDNQNIKYELIVLKRAGVELQGIGVDPMVGDYLLEAGARSHKLENLAERYLQRRMIPINELIGSGREQKTMAEVEVARAAEYATEDVDVTCRLADRIEAELKREGLWELYWELERPLIPVLADMQSTGIRVDVGELRRQSQQLDARLEQLVDEIFEMAGREFSIASPKQLSEVLFEELELPVLKRTKTGASTSQDVLERLAALHPLPATIIQHRHLAKLKSTYLDALPSLVNPETGRVHASFNQVVAATGRLSSSDPNLQNIPIRTDEGRLVRKAFVPGQDGWLLLCADYSQIELRMLAHFSGDSALQAAFREGADIHTAVASEVFGVDPRDVDRNQRRIAKAVNFGVIYGQSPFGLSQALGIDQQEAAAFIEDYFDRYAGVDSYLQNLLRQCARTGYARTILGRRRRISGVRTTGGRQRNLAERTAINTVVQGSAADLIKRAMIHLHERLARERFPAKMLLQIHDELVFEVPASDVDALADRAREEMVGALELDVPLVVDVSIGKNWYEVEPI